MPTLSVISSGSSLWMPLDDGFHDSISNVAVLMASIQKDPLLIRIALVPSVHPIIVYTLATKAYKSLKIRKIRKKNPETSGKTETHQCLSMCNCVTLFTSFKAVCKAISLNFYNDNTFFLHTWCDINPFLVFFLKKQQAIPRRGKSQGTIGLIVLLNRSIITIRPRLPTGTKYSRGVSRKEKLKEQNPKESNLWPPYWQCLICSNRHSGTFVCHWNQSNTFWLLVMADTKMRQSVFLPPFIYSWFCPVGLWLTQQTASRVLQRKQLAQELDCLAVLHSTYQALLQRRCS